MIDTIAWVIGTCPCYLWEIWICVPTAERQLSSTILIYAPQPLPWLLIWPQHFVIPFSMTRRKFDCSLFVLFSACVPSKILLKLICLFKHIQIYPQRILLSTTSTLLAKNKSCGIDGDIYRRILSRLFIKQEAPNGIKQMWSVEYHKTVFWAQLYFWYVWTIYQIFLSFARGKCLPLILRFLLKETEIILKFKVTFQEYASGLYNGNYH